MQVERQQIIVIRTIQEIHDISLSHKFKKLISNPETTIEDVKNSLYPHKQARTRQLNDYVMKDIPQEKVEEAVITIKVIFSYVDGSRKEIIIWDSLTGFHAAEYKEAKDIGDKMQRLLAREDYLIQE